VNQKLKDDLILIDNPNDDSISELIQNRFKDGKIYVKKKN
jgi:hypothetical protein